MELSELTKNISDIFGISDVNELGSKMLEALLTGDTETILKVKDTLPDLKTDWLQSIYQYWLADRDGKKQDYTPKSISYLTARLATLNDGTIQDVCAGSGALTIAVWSIDPNRDFECIEFDENVIPFLLLNLTIRNIKATVLQKDVLNDDIYAEYKVIPSEDVGKVKKNDNNYQQSTI